MGSMVRRSGSPEFVARFALSAMSKCFDLEEMIDFASRFNSHDVTSIDLKLAVPVAHARQAYGLV